MKNKILKIILTVFECLFFVAVPLGIFLWKCTTLGGKAGGTKFIVCGVGYIILFAILLLLKHIFLKNYFNDLQGKIANYESILAVETNKSKIKNCEKALHISLIMRDCFNALPVLVILLFAILLVSALEKDLITLANVMSIIAISMVLGYGCRLARHLTIKSKVIKDNKKEKSNI